ncbi:MAG: glucokinase [Synechococcaceae bacterium WB9_2_112]|nr:glucokinase [Synechococcaceae bacterium WB9_2_112]
MTTLLAGDIGGTKTLLSLYRSGGGGLEQLVSERYVSADWPDLAPMVLAFLRGPVAGLGLAQPDAACFAVAGPVQAGQAQLTNLPWQLSEQGLAAATGIARLALVNDFAVMIYGLPHLQPEQQVQIRPGVAVTGAPLLVLGAGTGLGVAYGVPTPSGLQAIASEGSHAEFAPRTADEWHLKQWLQADLGLDRLSTERVVSGTGLGLVARWMLAARAEAHDHPLAAVAADPAQDLPAAVAQAATAGDPLARQALALWLSAYGSVTGDLALAALCRGGIWLAGGTAAKLVEALRSPVFVQAYLNKGRLAEVLEPIPITAITDPAIGLYSAACRARMLVG